MFSMCMAGSRSGATYYPLVPPQVASVDTFLVGVAEGPEEVLDEVLVEDDDFDVEVEITVEEIFVDEEIFDDDEIFVEEETGFLLS